MAEFPIGDWPGHSIADDDRWPASEPETRGRPAVL